MYELFWNSCLNKFWQALVLLTVEAWPQDGPKQHGLKEAQSYKISKKATRPIHMIVNPLKK